MKKILSYVLLVVVILPCMFLLTACGELKSLSGKTFVLSKVEVTGTLNKDQCFEEYKNMKFTFTDTEMTLVNGSSTDSWEYKLENKKVYQKVYGKYRTEAFAKISGKYLVTTETRDGEVLTCYFSEK